MFLPRSVLVPAFLVPCFGFQVYVWNGYTIICRRHNFSAQYFAITFFYAEVYAMKIESKAIL